MWVADDALGLGSMVICRPTLMMRIGDTTCTVPFSLGAPVPGSDADALVGSRRLTVYGAPLWKEEGPGDGYL